MPGATWDNRRVWEIIEGHRQRRENALAAKGRRGVGRAILFLLLAMALMAAVVAFRERAASFPAWAMDWATSLLAPAPSSSELRIEPWLELPLVNKKLEEMRQFMLSAGIDLPQLAVLLDLEPVLRNRSPLIYVAPSQRILRPYERKEAMTVGLVGSRDPAQRGWRIIIYPEPFLDDDLSVEEGAVIFFANYLLLQDAKRMEPLAFHRQRAGLEAWAWTRTLVNVYEPIRHEIKAPRVEEIYRAFRTCKLLWRADDASPFQACWADYHRQRMQW